MKRIVVALVFATLASTLLIASSQPSQDDERRAAITLLRMINTAENAARQRGGKYLSMAELLEHPAMSRVKTDVAMNGNAITYRDAQVRLALSANASQYIVTVVRRAPSYAAAFTDEQGVIYTGKALE